MSVVSRYIRVMDFPDKFTADVCYVDRTTGKEIMRYDGADPANTREEYGAISDDECFGNRGLDRYERVDESKILPDSSWNHRYQQIPEYED